MGKQAVRWESSRCVGDAAPGHRRGSRGFYPVLNGREGVREADLAQELSEGVREGEEERKRGINPPAQGQRSLHNKEQKHQKKERKKERKAKRRRESGMPGKTKESAEECSTLKGVVYQENQFPIRLGYNLKCLCGAMVPVGHMNQCKAQLVDLRLQHALLKRCETKVARFQGRGRYLPRTMSPPRVLAGEPLTVKHLKMLAKEVKPTLGSYRGGEALEKYTLEQERAFWAGKPCHHEAFLWSKVEAEEGFGTPDSLGWAPKKEPKLKWKMGQGPRWTPPIVHVINDVRAEMARDGLEFDLLAMTCPLDYKEEDGSGVAAKPAALKKAGWPVVTEPVHPCWAAMAEKGWVHRPARELMKWFMRQDSAATGPSRPAAVPLGEADTPRRQFLGALAGETKDEEERHQR